MTSQIVDGPTLDGIMESLSRGTFVQFMLGEWTGFAVKITGIELESGNKFNGLHYNYNIICNWKDGPISVFYNVNTRKGAVTL